MIFSKSSPLLVGLDVGTGSIKMAVAEPRSDGGLTLMGVHAIESRGIRKGEVVDHAAANDCILRAIQETEDSLGIEIRGVELALTGGHIESLTHRGTIAITGDTHQITEEDVEDVVDRARTTAALPEDRSVLHVIRQQFYVDGKTDVTRPVGLVGSRLEVDIHLIHGITTRLENTMQCLHSRYGGSVDVNNPIFSGLASALAVLGKQEKEIGAILLDIGAGTTEYVVYGKGMLRMTGVLPVGGDHLINDLRLGLKLQSQRQAETLLHEHGSVALDPLVNGKTVKMKTSELLDRERMFYLEDIHTILHHRMDEILRIVHDQLAEQEMLDAVSAGVFFTGGCSRVPGLLDLAQSIFGMPASLASAQGFDGQLESLSLPEMATALGLVRYGYAKGSNFKTSENGLGGMVKKWLGI